jgi:hypothetical protein
LEGEGIIEEVEEATTIITIGASRDLVETSEREVQL